MNKALWLERRRLGITGTDVSKIMGFSKWGTAHSVWLDKMGISDPVEDNPSMLWGRLLEPVIRSYYADLHKVNVVVPDTLQNKDYSWVIGSPDGIVINEGGEWAYGLEIKTAKVLTKFSSGLWDNKVPVDYEYQCRWYMLLTDLPFWDLAVLKNGSEYNEHRITRDEALEEAMLKKCQNFWEDYVVPRVEPR